MDTTATFALDSIKYVRFHIVPVPVTIPPAQDYALWWWLTAALVTLAALAVIRWRSVESVV